MMGNSSSRNVLTTMLLLACSVGAYSQQLIPFEKDSLWGYCIRESKAVAIVPQYECANPFKNGQAIVKKGKKYFLINAANKVLSKLPYSIVDFDYGLAPVQVRGKYGFIDYSGNIIIGAKYDGADAFAEYEKTTVQLKDQVLEINRKGDVLSARSATATDGMDVGFLNDAFEKPTYVTAAHNGYAKYGYRFLYGYADSTGKVIAKAKYGIFSEVFVDSLCKVHYFSRAQKLEYYKSRLDQKFSSQKKDTVVDGKVHAVYSAVQVITKIGYIDTRGVEFFESSFNPEKFEYEEYWRSGAVRRKCTFVYDELDGTYYEYDETGRINVQLEFKNGVEVE